jgi:hypothetical protein
LAYFKGVDRVSHGMTSRLGLLFNWKFWAFFFRSIKEILEEKSLSFFFKIVFHFLSLLSLLPLFIFFPWDFFAKRVETKSESREIVNTEINEHEAIPMLNSSSEKIDKDKDESVSLQITNLGVNTQEANPMVNFSSSPTTNIQKSNLNKFLSILMKAGLFLIGICTYIVYFCLFLETISIYSRFLLYIITATVKNYQLTLTIFGVLAGILAFVLQIRSKVRNTYIGLKMTIVQVASDLHKEKIESNNIRKNQDEWKSIDGLDMQTHVPELILRSKDGLPCIPKPMYDMIIKKIYPIGIQRLKLLIKLVSMTLFVTYIVMVNQVIVLQDLFFFSQN